MAVTNLPYRTLSLFPSASAFGWEGVEPHVIPPAGISVVGRDISQTPRCQSILPMAYVLLT